MLVDDIRTEGVHLAGELIEVRRNTIEPDHYPVPIRLGNINPVTRVPVSKPGKNIVVVQIDIRALRSRTAN